MVEEENYSQVESESEIKPKRILTEAQKSQLASARAKAITMRKIRAEERKVELKNDKIDNKISEMEKQKEILKLQQMALEQNLDIDIKPKGKPRPEPEPEPVKKEDTPPPSPKAEEPSPVVSPPASPVRDEEPDFKWVNGRLMFFE